MKGHHSKYYGSMTDKNLKSSKKHGYKNQGQENSSSSTYLTKKKAGNFLKISVWKN